MSKVIMTIGFAVAALGYVVGIWGLATSLNVPTDIYQGTTNPLREVRASFRVVTFGVVTMMATTLALVMVFAHGSRVGDQE